MRRIALLCWEAGRGLGHIVVLSQIAKRLQERGWTAVLALPPGKPTYGLVPPGIQTIAAPLWGEGTVAQLHRSGSSATMGDMLAEIGLASEEWTREQITRWHLRFAAIVPDLVIADYAPGAVLAARSRIPCITVGAAFSVPPRGLNRFPRLHALSEPRYDEAAVLDTVNTVLARYGAEALPSLGEALRGDKACACTLPVLDPYSDQRGGDWYCPILSEPLRKRETTTSQILCYFNVHRDPRLRQKLVECLRDNPGPTLLFAPGLSRPQIARLEEAGVYISDRPVSVGSHLQQARLVIHAGGQGVAAAAILAGCPQVILELDIDKELTGRALEKAGVARRHRFDLTRVATIRETIAAAYRDPALEDAARAMAEQYADCRSTDPVAMIADICTEYL